jgi:Putative zinc-finger
MDHTYIDDQQIAERYLLGRLSPEEREAFEEHTMVCADCLERLELAAGLRSGLQQTAVAVAAAATRAGALRFGLLAALARLGRSRGMALAFTALLLVALIPSGLLLRQVREQQREIDRAGHPAPPDPRREAELQSARQALADQRLQADRERGEKERLQGELSRALHPQANTPILTLAPERSASGPRPPAQQIVLPRGPGWIVLALDVEVADYPTYRVRLRGLGGALLWQGAGFEPDPQGTLTLSLPATLLAPGDFSVEVEGLPASGQPVRAARFTFRAIKAGT